ncbi:hypothetical protein ABIE26_004798 [Pedobacter africanus]|uniref:Uncharacterized protein n=1 Tax=Pedobacter africanus TaxID=151894 RepID=A0ACC6L382_9SPHI|nr:DUF5007 domain-containing protein [Pedobacter africanus]MDR6785733.1 hypothetical protein [Pedobacter africanus]
MRHFKKRYIAIFGILTAFFWMNTSSCYKGPEGYLADSVFYTPRQVIVVPGKTQTLAPSIDGQGSSKPLTISIQRVHGVADGKDYTGQFLQEVDVTEWTAEFTKKEKTIAEILAKQKEVKRALLEINPISGIITINEVRNEQTLPVGEFWLDIKIKNIAGEFISKKAVKLITRAYKTSTVTTPVVTGDIAGASVNIIRKGDGHSLKVKVLEKDGSIVPLDSLSSPLGTSATFSAFTNYGLTKEAGVYTYQILFPWPAFGTQRIYLERKKLVKDPLTQVAEMKKIYSFDYGFSIIPSGEWEMTVQMR